VGGRGRRLDHDRRPRPPGDLLIADPDLELAERAALLAGELLLRRFGGPIRGLDHKSSATDMVSDADREAEAAIVELLDRERPDDAVVGEEGTGERGSTGRRWLVDPLDGTTNYLYGHPQWCVSVALEDADGGVVGVVHDPSRGETFRAARGHGAELNGAPIRVRAGATLATALVATGFGYDAARRERQARELVTILPRVRDVRRAGSAALDLAWLAAGRLDGYFERGLNPWDWSAGRLLATEAGALAQEVLGPPDELIAATPDVFDDLVALVAEAEA
jgi:myo-inositol-1(or 4)-monophosphatase